MRFFTSKPKALPEIESAEDYKARVEKILAPYWRASSLERSLFLNVVALRNHVADLRAKTITNFQITTPRQKRPFHFEEISISVLLSGSDEWAQASALLAVLESSEEFKAAEKIFAPIFEAYTAAEAKRADEIREHREAVKTLEAEIHAREQEHKLKFTTDPEVATLQAQLERQKNGYDRAVKPVS